MENPLYVHDIHSNPLQTTKPSLQRDYICPCGKSYLSYPALFTHIKQKHNGNAPGQVIKPTSTNQNKRGRPRLNKNIQNKDQETSKQQDQILSDLWRYVRKWNWGHTPQNLKENYQKTQFYNTFKQFKQNQNKNIENDVENKRINNSCSRIFHIFLRQIQQHKQLSLFFEQFMILVMLFHRGLNDHRKQQGDNIQVAINYANEFILLHLEGYLMAQKLKENTFFNYQRILYMIQMIFKWMEEKKYISHWLKINPQFLKYI